MSPNNQLEQFSIPEQTLQTLSFCEPSASQLSEWVQQLPMANLGESSRQLYHAIIEINQLVINPETRFRLIEIMRPAIQQVCMSLKKHYLNQPVFLPPKARKVSKLAMAMDNHLIVAYKAVIQDRKKLNQSLLSQKPKRITAQAIYHAISTTAQIIVRAYHLYTPIPEKTWHELHQLYLIAESNQLLDSQIEDKRNKFVHKTTIEDAYKRAMMIGCCKANQIRQSDISNIYDATELWSKHVHIVDGMQTSNFSINLSEDSAPVHSELSSDRSPFCRGIDLQPLLNLFKEYLALADKSHDAIIKGINIPSTIKKHCLNFLLTSWETLTERSTTRLPSGKSVKTCIGFSATHFYLSGGVDFETQLQRDGSQAQTTNKFYSTDVKHLSDSKDPWENAFDAGHDDSKPIDHSNVSMQKITSEQSLNSTTSNSAPPSYPEYTSRLLDISPNGYCIKWENEIPTEIKAGEIIGINKQEHHTWAVGVIRWISQPRTGITTMGVELLAASAIPCGAKAVTDSQIKPAFMRALLLPAQETIGQPASFIAPNIPFKENLSVVLNQYGETSEGLLGSCTLSTGSFSQFIFESQSLRSELPNSDSDDDIWPEI